MSPSNAFPVSLGRTLLAAIRAHPAFACLAALLLAAAARADDAPTVLSIDHYLTDNASGDSRHEVLPMAVFDGSKFVAVTSWRDSVAMRAKRQQLLDASPDVQVLYRGRRIGTVHVTDTHLQAFHCVNLIVGSGSFEAAAPQPASEVRDAVWGLNVRTGEKTDFKTQAFLAVSGAVGVQPADGEPLVAAVTDPAELEGFAQDVLTLEPRPNLGKLSQDETQAYRLDRYGAVVVVRKRRSATMLPGPAGIELESPLFTDAVVVRTGSGEHEVLWLSTGKEDAWGKGPRDDFIDAVDLGDGAVYLAFRRWDYEAILLRLFRLSASGGPVAVFQDDLYGC